MPKNKNAYLRYLIIHSQVKRNKYRHGYPKKEDLLNSLNEQGFSVSESTVEKDLNFLKYERGAPLEYDRYQRCYRYTDEWEFDIPLSADNVRTIHMLINKLSLFGDAQEFKMMKDTIDRLSVHFELERQHPNDKIDKYILFEYIKDFEGKQHLSPIYDAIYEKKEIRFTHCKYETDGPTERTIQPYILKQHNNRWYVIGKENGAPRIFGLDRVSGLKVTDTYFKEDTGMYDDILNILRDSVGIMAFGFNSEDVILYFNREKANYIKAVPLHRSQKILNENTEGMTIGLHLKITTEFLNECILQYGDAVKVISPPNLIDKVRRIYRKALDSYDGE